MSKRKPENKTNVRDAYSWIADKLDMSVSVTSEVISEWNDYITSLAHKDPIASAELELKAKRNSAKRKKK